MPALNDHPVHTRVAAGRLLQTLVGTTGGLTSLHPVDSAGLGGLAEVHHPALFGPTCGMTAYLCYAPELGREDYTLMAESDGYMFAVGRLGVLSRPGFHDPTQTDTDPYFRLVAEPPLAAIREDQDAYRGLYTALVEFACRRPPGFTDRGHARRLLRLYQARALLNPRVISLSLSRPDLIPLAAVPFPRMLQDRRLGGWDLLPIDVLPRLLAYVLPASGEPIELTDRGTLYAHLGLNTREPPAVTGNLELRDSWLFSMREAPPPNRTRPLSAAGFRLEMMNEWTPGLIVDRSAIDQALDQLMQQTRIPSELFRGVSETGRSSAANLPQSGRSNVFSRHYDQAPTPPPPPPPPPPVLDIDSVPEEMYPRLVERLTVALAGQAGILDLTMEVTSETGRTTTITPTPAPPPPPPPLVAQAEGVRGIHLDE